MALEINNIITYDEMIKFVVDYIVQLYNNRYSLTIPNIQNKFTDSQSRSWTDNVDGSRGPKTVTLNSSASVTVTTEYNQNSLIQPLTPTGIKDKLLDFLSTHATDSESSHIIIGEKGEIVNFQYIMNFFNVIIKFINTYFLHYTLTSNKDYMPTNFNSGATITDKLSSDTDFQKILHDALNVDSNWIIKSTFSSSVTSSSSSCSSSSSSSSCSSSSSSSFITYLNIS